MATCVSISIASKGLRTRVRSGRSIQTKQAAVGNFREDIPVLVSHFVKKFSHRMGKQVDSIPPETMAAFQCHSWPGNIRELQNLVERAVILTRDCVLPNPFHKKQTDLMISSPHRTRRFQSSMTLDDTNRALIVGALEQFDWVVGGPNGAANKLGLKRTTLIARMRRLGISRQITHNGTEMIGMAPESKFWPPP